MELSSLAEKAADLIGPKENRNPLEALAAHSQEGQRFDLIKGVRKAAALALKGTVLLAA